MKKSKENVRQRKRPETLKKRIKKNAVPILLFLLLDGLVSFLFYRSVIALLLLLPFYRRFRKEYDATVTQKKKQEVREQFLTGMQLFLSALQAGYTPENAFGQALPEAEKIYPPSAWIIREFKQIRWQIGRNVPVEKVLLDMGRRSCDEDIESFCEVFYTSRRLGGDLLTVTADTIEGIRHKTDTIREIETELTGKILEQRIMSLIPLFILGYIQLTSPGFLDDMYHNAAGIVIMSIALGIYLAAYLWSSSIIHKTLDTH